MSDELAILCMTAASVGLVHTILGPDHYLPFVAMSRVGRWSLTKTVVITVLCGIGHVLSSVVLGLIGIAFGVAVFKLETIEGIRGDVAGWLLLAFGFVYFVWGIRRAIRNKPHEHNHVHSDGTAHSHGHNHTDEHVHVHTTLRPADAETAGANALTPWVLFTIFLFGPCEPLIPIVMYPAARGSVWGVVLVAGVFGVVTIGTMTTVVLLSRLAVSSVNFGRLERYGHAAAGLVVLVCGVAIKAGL